MNVRSELIFNGCEFKDSERQYIATGLVDFFNQLANQDPCLDLRRLHKVIISPDFNKTYAWLQNCFPSAHPMGFRDDGPGNTYGAVMPWETNEGPGIIMILKSTLAEAFLPWKWKRFVATSLYLINHEAGHVDDLNKAIDARGDWVLGENTRGDIWYLTSFCWMEFIADFLAFKYLDGRSWQAAEKEFNYVVQNPSCATIGNSSGERLERILRSTIRLMAFVVASGKSLEEVSLKAFGTLNGSFLEHYWKEMLLTLSTMQKNRSGLWAEKDGFRELELVVRKIGVAFEGFYL